MNISMFIYFSLALIIVLFIITYVYLGIVENKLGKFKKNSNQKQSGFAFNRETIHPFDKNHIPYFLQSYTKKYPNKKAVTTKKFYDPELYSVFREEGKK